MSVKKIALLLGVALVGLCAMAWQDAKQPFTEAFDENDKDWVSAGANPYFVLETGYILEFEGKEDGKTHQLTITVLNETRKIGTIETRVVEERETVDGEIEEISRNYFAMSRRTNNLYYFGEAVDMYRDGKITGHGGSWIHGEKGAHYGLMIPGTPLLGARYYQEVAPEVAQDRAEILSLSESRETPAGKFDKVLKIEETSPLEPQHKEYKYYAPGVGLIQDGHLKLVKYGKRKGQ